MTPPENKTKTDHNWDRCVWGGCNFTLKVTLGDRFKGSSPHFTSPGPLGWFFGGAMDEGRDTLRDLGEI